MVGRLCPYVNSAYSAIVLELIFKFVIKLQYISTNFFVGHCCLILKISKNAPEQVANQLSCVSDRLFAMANLAVSRNHSMKEGNSGHRSINKLVNVQANSLE